MKKIFAIVLSAAALLMGAQAYAQLSVGAGWLNSTETTTVKAGNTSSSAASNLNGFYAGAQYNINIVSRLGVAPGVYFSGLFGKRTDDLWLATGEKLFSDFHPSEDDDKNEKDFVWNILNTENTIDTIIIK